jgi:hypothetical protein
MNLCTYIYKFNIIYCVNCVCNYTIYEEMHMNVIFVPCNKLVHNIYTLRTEVTSSSLCKLYHCSPIWIIVHHMYLLRTSFHRTALQTTILTSDILYTSLFYCKAVNFTQKHTIFKTVDWFRQIVIIFLIWFSPPWRWSHEWSKHVGDLYATSLHP